MPAQRKNRFHSLGKSYFGTLLALALLVAALLSASPSLHERFHADASSAAHLCAVTLFASGNCEAGSSPPVLLAPAIVAVLVVAVFAGSLLVPARVSSILEHAPPFSA